LLLSNSVHTRPLPVAAFARVVMSEAAAAPAASSVVPPPPQFDLDGFAIDNRPFPKKGTIAYWQRTIWVLLDDPSSSKAAKAISSAMMVVILLSIVSFTIASNPSEVWFDDVWVNLTTGEVIEGNYDNTAKLPGATLADEGTVRRVSTLLDETRSPFSELETFCIIIFTIEYFTRMFASPQGPGVLRYVTTLSNIIDLVSILPFYIELVLLLAGVSAGGLTVLSVLRLIRLTRITRIFKMSKNFEGLIMLLRSLKKSGPALMMLFAFMGISGILFATLIFTIEGGEYDVHRKQYVRVDGSASPFESIPGSLWWTIVTMTTVGYGDQYPVSVGGKIIAVLTMFCGLVVLSLPITIIGANFDDEYRELRKRTQEEKERQRRQERRERLRQQKEMQQQQQQTAQQQGDSAKATPLRPTGKGAAEAATPAAGDSANPLTFPPGSPVVTGGKGTDDPIKKIQEMIHESHYELTRDIERMMVDHENKLRTRIKQVLRQHAASVADLRSSPLDQMRPQPVVES